MLKQFKLSDAHHNKQSDKQKLNRYCKLSRLLLAECKIKQILIGLQEISLKKDDWDSFMDVGRLKL